MTDMGVTHLTKIHFLEVLTIQRTEQVNKESIAHFNQMPYLKRLNIAKTKIALSDLAESLDNPNLQEVFLSSEEVEHNMEEKALILKERMPQCNIYLDCNETSDVFGNPEKPIF